jgi:hypothetical protein
MPAIVTTVREIPTAPYYVLSNDRFMSGWGRAHTSGAFGNPYPDRGALTNTIILPCENWTEALIVKENAERRTDQTRVRIVVNKPRLRSEHVYSLLTRLTAEWWFQPGAFK